MRGTLAVQGLQVVPMVVQEHASMIDDNSPVVKSYFVSDGCCGFGWINVKPGNSAFAKWLKEKELARPDSYDGGVKIWVHQFNQSMQKKETYAYAFADSLKSHGVRAFAGSRMD